MKSLIDHISVHRNIIIERKVQNLNVLHFDTHVFHALRKYSAKQMQKFDMWPRAVSVLASSRMMSFAETLFSTSLGLRHRTDIKVLGYTFWQSTFPDLPLG